MNQKQHNPTRMSLLNAALISLICLQVSISSSAYSFPFFPKEIICPVNKEVKCGWDKDLAPCPERPFEKSLTVTPSVHQTLAGKWGAPIEGYSVTHHYLNGSRSDSFFYLGQSTCLKDCADYSPWTGPIDVFQRYVSKSDDIKGYYSFGTYLLEVSGGWTSRSSILMPYDQNGKILKFIYRSGLETHLCETQY